MSTDRIEGPRDLERLAQALRSDGSKSSVRVLICMTGCRALGSLDVARAFRERLQDRGLSDDVAVIGTGCIGLCARAPVVVIEPHGYFYGGVRAEDVEEIIDVTIQDGQPVERLAGTRNGEPVVRLADLPFYKAQQRVVLANCGRIDPRRIEDAIAHGAYVAAVDVLHTWTPERVVEEVSAAGLRGRGGAGFPTGRKWDFCRRAAGAEKYLICNADEGDPGAFMDRALKEGDPHRVLEGMIIAAYAVGASQGFVYVRAEYPIAVEHVTIALRQARALGLLGDDIAGSGFSFDIEVREGAGAFVCGEETALIASLEGGRGVPRSRPPFPAQSGFRGKPTNINNVETFANVPLIIERGAGWYSSRGTEGSKGTKIFALAGKVENTGLVEVPMGISLREVVFEIGGGIPDGRAFKAAQLGGPSGGCVPAEYLDYPIDYDTLPQIGAIMGSGGLIVMDEDTCMVDVARYFLDFVQSESCGKCVPCRVGTRHMLDTLKRICAGEGREGDVEELEALAQDVKAGSLCGLGQTAPNPVLTTIRYFRDEYDAHIRGRHCPAHVCRGLFRYAIVAEQCKGCGRCLKACPEGAISGERKGPHLLDEAKCVHCGACFSVCPFEAVHKVHPDWSAV